MKLKSLLKVVTSPKYTITIPDRNFYTYNVDYTADIRKEVYDTHTNCDCKVHIPKDILEREVEFVHAYKGELMITVSDAKA